MVQFRFGWRLVDFGFSVKANSIEWYGISDKNGGQALALGPRLRDWSIDAVSDHLPPAVQDHSDHFSLCAA